MKAFKEKHKNASWYKLLRKYYYEWHEFGKGLIHAARFGTYMPRKFLVENERKLIYVDNAKAASSSIKAAMEDMRGLNSYHDVYRTLKSKDNYMRDIDISAYSDYYKFSFVRNPFKRLYSCYENKFHTDLEISGKKHGRLYYNTMYYDWYMLGWLRNDHGFLHFAKIVAHLPDCLSDVHFMTQYRVTHDRKGRSICDYVGKMEDLPEAFEVIRQKYDLPALKHFNKTKSDNWMDAYDLPTARAVYKRYKRDIETFGYKAEAQELFAYLEKKKAGA